MAQAEWRCVQSAVGHVLQPTLATGPWLESSIHPWAPLCVPFLFSWLLRHTELELGPGWAVVTTPQLLVTVLRVSQQEPSAVFPSTPALDGPAMGGSKIYY